MNLRLASGLFVAAVGAGGCFVPNPMRISLRDDAPSEPVEEPTAMDAVEVSTMDAGSEPSLDAMDASDAGDAADAADAADVVDAYEAFVFDIVRPDVVDVQDVVCPADAPTREAASPFVDPADCERADYGMCGTRCLRTDEDPNACGAGCGTCEGRPCIAATCCTAAPTGTCPVVSPHDPMATGEYLTRLYSDRSNCGACGNRCSDQQNCVCGACRCMEPYTRCGEACVDTQTSHVNCGACGIRCAGGDVCIAGACAARPAFPQSCSELLPPDGGPHRLYFENDCAKPYNAYCEDLDTGATTWLALRQSDPITSRNYSFSRFADDPAASGTTVEFGRGLVTYFQRVRFEPEHARIATWDARHSTSQGWDFPNGIMVHQQFGVVSECKAASSERAVTNVDLTDLPFVLLSRWLHRGYMASGGETLRILPDGRALRPPTGSYPPARVVTADAKGRCGGVYPDGLDYSFRSMYIRVGYQR